MAVKRVSLVISLAVFLIAALIISSVAATGNGAPSGAHYNLNLIGVKKTDQLPNDANDGHRIFVNLLGKSRIILKEGDFSVIDADATDGKAVFQLPAPENVYDESGNYVSPGNYRVYIRALGKPGGKANLTTCGNTTDVLSGEVTTVCSLDNITLTREKGKSLFSDVTQSLTTVSYYDELLQKNVRVDIFDSIFEEYLWDYDNNGLKLVQLRFYPSSS